jgi:hypothetical protein
MNVMAEVFPGSSNSSGRSIGAWYLRLVSTAGETLLTSEQYYSKYNAERAAKHLGLVPVVVSE